MRVHSWTAFGHYHGDDLNHNHDDDHGEDGEDHNNGHDDDLDDDHDVGLTSSLTIM